MDPANDLRDQVVVVVDDDGLVLEALSQLLRSLGVGQVHTCESAPDALDLIRGGTPVTTLLTDISMPGMDGPLFLRQLAELGLRARIVLVSGVSNDLMHSIGELGRSHGLNVVGFIHKPVSRESLRALLTSKVSGPEPAPVKAAPTATKLPAPDVSPQRLKEAFARGELQPWYQPKVDVNQLQVVGVEALARWRLSDDRLISPGQFVPAIEAAGLSTEFFFLILGQVLSDLSRWQRQGFRIKGAVNLSMDCAMELDLPDKIQSALVAADVSAGQLVIEVTESRLMSHRSAAMETLTRLSLMGCLLSIDDFGTGYSSLAQLADLPFGELKIDGSFVRRAGSDAKANAILETTVTFGRSLGMAVVAEGVETHDQLDILRRLGAPVMQGFLVARPMPVAGFDPWLANWRPGLPDRPGCSRPLTVLIVDDSASMRVVIEAELRERIPAIRVLFAANAQEAEHVARTESIDAATLDFYMPGIDGIELLRHLRDMRPAARFVLLTSNLADDIARATTGLGAMYCPKPLTAPQADRIARYFRDR